MQPLRRDAGRIEVVFGSLFSGEQEELIRRLRRARIARRQGPIFKPAMDRRSPDGGIFSRSALRIPSRSVSSPEEIAGCRTGGIQAAGIDGVQFFETGIVPARREPARRCFAPSPSAHREPLDSPAPESGGGTRAT